MSNVVDVAAGYGHSLALKSDGKVVVWGANYEGQTNVPAGLSNVVAIAAGFEYSLALKGDGTVVAWGATNYASLMNFPVGLSNVVAIAAGYYDSLALKSDGTVVAWGVNSLGAANVPAGLSNVVAIAAGGSHSLALKSDGTIVAWGGNGDGQTSVPAGLINVVAIAGGGTHSLVLRRERIPAQLALLTGNNTFQGAVTAARFSGAFTGDGSGLTNVNASIPNLDASRITTGTLDAARLPANVALLDGAQTFTGPKTFNNPGNAFAGDGGGLTGLNAPNLVGIVPDARLSGNVALRSGGNTFTGNQIVASGNVGIGTNNPQSPLHVVGAVIASNFVGSGAGLTGLSAGQMTGTLPASVLPAGVVTNGATGASISGTFTGNGSGLSNVNAATLGGLGSGAFWKTNGNAGVSGGFLGTTDNQPLEFRANNQRGLRLVPSGTNTPSIVGGWAINSVTPGVVGATIAGGGGASVFGTYSNSVVGDFGTIGGGAGNLAHGMYGTVAGGLQNIASNNLSSVVGGRQNTAGNTLAMVGGGLGNTANGYASFIGGGWFNSADSDSATIAGGRDNRATGDFAAVGGGMLNWAYGTNSTIPGGLRNTASHHSFAAGTRARADHLGSFVWADPSGLEFSTRTTNQFLIRATGGVGINTNNTEGVALAVNGATRVDGTFSSGVGHTTSGAQSAALGFANTASGFASTALGANSTSGGDYSLAAGTQTIASGLGAVALGKQTTADGWWALSGGYRARANHLFSFVWSADSTESDFSSTANGQFLIRAGGGVGINTASPLAPLHVGGGHLRVDGLAGEAAYMGGDGAGNDVEFGSRNPAIQNVVLWNPALAQTMSLFAGAGSFSGLQIANADSRLRLFASSASGYAATEYHANGRQWHAGVGGTAAGGLANKFYLYDATAGATRFVADPNGYIGIGTEFPDMPLSIRGTGASHEWLSLKGADQISRWHLNNRSGGLNFAQSGVADARLFLASNGRVGFGTDNPQAHLHLYAPQTPAVLRLHSASGPGFGRVEFVSDPMGSGSEWRPGYIESSDNGDFTGGLRFVVNGTGSGSRFGEIETMRILNGMVAIRTVNPVSALTVNGGAHNTTGVWSIFSDARLKENIEPMEAGSLDRMLELRGVTFDYKNADQREGYDGQHRGWIAQEVEKVFPEWVKEAPDGMKMVTPVGFNALAVEALRELRAEKDAEIAALKARLERLESLLLRDQQAE